MRLNRPENRETSWVIALILLGISIAGCGSSSSTGIDPASLGSPTRLTFNGALTRNFSGTQGEMEFNIALLQSGDPPQPVTQLSPA
ncbi:hypothetical protein ACVW0R_001130 [Thermostichus sp. MS-CIW-15]